MEIKGTKFYSHSFRFDTSTVQRLFHWTQCTAYTSYVMDCALLTA